MKNKSALLLGSSGFVGSSLQYVLIQTARKLQLLQHRTLPASPGTAENGSANSNDGIKNRAMDSTNLKIAYRSLESQLSADSPSAPLIIHHGSITRFNWARLEKDPPEVIYHAARIPGRGRFSRLVAGLRGMRANTRLLSWMSHQKRAPLLVFISGSLVYGDRGTDVVFEDSQLYPISFQRQYILAERAVLSAQTKAVLPVMIIRPPWIYGPGSWFEQFYHRHIIQTGTIPAFGNGDQLMSFIHVDDLAGYIIHATEYLAGSGHSDPANNTTIHPFSHSGIPHREFVRILSEIYQKPIKWYSESWLQQKYGKTVREALTFSMKLGTRHHRIHEAYEFAWPCLKTGFTQVVEELQK